MEELKEAVAVAREAGAQLREALARPRQVLAKGSAIDLVTEMDQATNALIVNRLGAAYPDYGFLSEESPAIPGAQAARWIIDPIDGTTNYIHRYPFFAISIALERDARLILGVVYNPVADELFEAVAGRGAVLNGHPIQVSGTRVLGESLLTSGFPYDAWEKEDDNVAEWRRMLKRVRSLRCDGSSALDLCYVACGRTDGYWERGIEPWDVAAGAIIVAEAGGRVTDYQGGEDFMGSRQVVAANPQLHSALLRGLHAPW